MVSKLQYIQLSCLLFLMSSSYIRGAQSWTIATCESDYQGLAADINNLRVGYVGNSKMAAFTAHNGVAYKVPEDFALEPNVLGSNDLTLQHCTIGQILNANPFSAPNADNPANSHFWNHFIGGLALPFLTVSVGAICAAYNINIKNIDMRKWSALAAAAGAAGQALLGGMYNLCFGDSNIACKDDIARMSANLRARDKSDPKKWLIERSVETGLAELLIARERSATSLQDVQSSSAISFGIHADTVNDQGLHRLISENSLSFQRAFTALDALPPRDYLPEAQRFYAAAYRKQQYGRILGSSIAAVGALYLAHRAQ